jgi:hypothetical protein
MDDNLQRKIKKKIDDQKKTSDPRKNRKNKNTPDAFVWILIIAGAFIIFQWVFSTFEEGSRELTYKNFYEMVEANPQTRQVDSAVLTVDRVTGKLSDGKSFFVNIPS